MVKAKDVTPGMYLFCSKPQTVSNEDDADFDADLGFCETLNATTPVVLRKVLHVHGDSYNESGHMRTFIKLDNELPGTSMEFGDNDYLLTGQL